MCDIRGLAKSCRSNYFWGASITLPRLDAASYGSDDERKAKEQKGYRELVASINLRRLKKETTERASDKIGFIYFPPATIKGLVDYLYGHKILS